jgi:hypothetical protein
METSLISNHCLPATILYLLTTTLYESTTAEYQVDVNQELTYFARYPLCYGSTYFVSASTHFHDFKFYSVCHNQKNEGNAW